MNIKKRCALLFLFIPGFTFSLTIEEIQQNEAFREKHPELMAQYDQADKEHHETIEYKKYDKEHNSYVSLARGDCKLMSRFQAFKHWWAGDVPFENVIGKLDLNSFGENCRKSVLKLDQKNGAYFWEDSETRECELYRERFELNSELRKEAGKNLEIAMAELVNTDEAKKVSLIGSEVQIAYARFKILENKKSR